MPTIPMGIRGDRCLVSRCEHAPRPRRNREDRKGKRVQETAVRRGCRGSPGYARRRIDKGSRCCHVVLQGLRPLSCMLIDMNRRALSSGVWHDTVSSTFGNLPACFVTMSGYIKLGAPAICDLHLLPGCLCSSPST